ncbi:MAG: hypothetical protein ACI8P3_001814 [Saprospiraceae bacterium]|jgi:hypothetical protein
MENRDNNLTGIRPALDLSPASGEIEQFQNNTLRPILKFQHNLLIRICHLQFVKRKNVFFGLGEPKQLIYIEQHITQDKQFKNLLLGAIVGHFTLAEWDFYKTQEQKLRKRMTVLLIQRIQSDVRALVNP